MLYLTIMNNYRKTFSYLTITGLLLFIVACNPFPTNLHPATVEPPIIITSNPAPNQPDDLENLKIFLFGAIDKGDISSFQETCLQLKAAYPTIAFSQFIDEFGNTFLHRAAEKGNNLLLEFLLFYSIDKDTYIDAANYLDQTPLHIAVIHKHLDSIERLLAEGADFTLYDSEGFMPLHIAIIDGNLDIVKQLTQEDGEEVLELIYSRTKCKGEKKYTGIELAYMRKQIDILKYLIHLRYYKSDTNLQEEELLIALEYEWIDLIEDFMKEKRIEIEIVNEEDDQGILQLAANKGYLPLVKYLIDQLGKDPNDVCCHSRKDMKNTAGYQAIRGAHPKVLYYLLQQGANPHIEEGYWINNDPPSWLNKAIKRYIKYKQAIHTQDSSTLNATNNEAEKKLLDAKRNIDMLLGNRRLDVTFPEFPTNDNEKKRYKLPPNSLYKAIKAGPEVFFPLLYHSYVLNRRKIAAEGLEEYEGCDPIHSASKAGDKNLVEYLLSMNANINNKSAIHTTPLTYAVESGNIETVEYLLTKRAEVNTKRGNNYTLHKAVKEGHKDMLELLLNNRASIQGKKNDKTTLLHAAALSKNVVGADTTEMRISIQDIIARLGAKVINAKNSFGCTPLHYAAQIGNQASVSMLLAVRADVHAENEEGKTPLVFSTEENNLTITKQLMAAGANLNKCLSIYDQDKILKLILSLLKNEESTLGENAKIIDTLMKKADGMTLRKLAINILTTNPQTASPRLKSFCDRLIKEHNIQPKDCLASVIANNQDDYKFNKEEFLSFIYQLIELYGLSPINCIYQLILSDKEEADQLLCHLINKYKISPLHLLNNAITQGREDIVSLIIGPYYKSTKNIIIKQGIATNDFRVISHFIQYDKDNGSLNNVNYIISRATKLNKLDIVQFLITQCPLDPRMVVANLIKEISNTAYIANMYNMYIFVQHLMACNNLYPGDFVIWAATTAETHKVVKPIIIYYNLNPQLLIGHAKKMNNETAASFLTKFSETKKTAFSESEISDSNINLELHPTKKQKNNNDPS